MGEFLIYVISIHVILYKLVRFLSKQLRKSSNARFVCYTSK